MRLHRWVVMLAVSVSLSAWADESEPPPLPKDAVPPPMLVQAAPLSARDRMLNTWGFGFLGTSAVLKAVPDVNNLLRTTVPILGVRWWTPWRRLGLELGVGAMVSGSHNDVSLPQQGVMAGDGPSTTEMLVHVSAPLVLGSTQHVILFIAPEGRAGFSRFQPDDSGAGVVTASTFELSLKAGVEIFFSFIGLDNLSLEAGVRAGVVHELRSVVQVVPLQGEHVSVFTQTRFATSVIANPWDLFTSTLAARYYF